MAIVLDYKGSPNIPGFEKDIFGIGFLNHFNISRMDWECTNPKYRNALKLVQISEERWDFHIDWRQIAMTSQQEYFTIKVMYKDQVKLTRDFVVKYPQRKLTLNDVEVKLDKNETLWGTEGGICNIKLSLKSGLQHWMFSDNSVEISISREGEFCLSNGVSYNIALRDIARNNCNIPISFNGYSSLPIRSKVTKNIHYTINQYNGTLAFSFNPRPYSYAATIERLNGGRRKYGCDVYDLFRISVVRKNKYSPESDNICVCHKNSDYFSIKKDGNDYVIALKKELSWQRYSEGIKASVTFSVDGGKYTFGTDFSVGLNGNTYDSHHFQIEKGVAPELDINSVTAYVGEESVNHLIIKNKCNTNISCSISHNSNLVKIINSERFTINTNGEHLVKYRVNTGKTGCQDISFKVSSAEAESIEKNVRVIIKEAKSPKVRIVSDQERQQTFFLDQKLEAGTAVANVIVENVEDGAAHTRPLRLSDIKFLQDFSISDEYKDVCIEKGGKERVILVTTLPLIIDEHNAICLDNGSGKLDIDWNCYECKDKIEVPVVEPKFSEIQVELSQSEELILGQKIDEGQKIASVIIKNCEQENAHVYPVNISDIILTKGFSFAQSETLELCNGENAEIDIIATDAFTINEEGEDGTDKSLILGWKYSNSKKDIRIPVISPEFFYINPEPIFNKHGYIFAHSGEKAIKITTLKFCNEGKNETWWENQRISVEKPFSFSDTDCVCDISISPDTDIPVYVYIPDIEGLDDSGQNLIEELPLKFEVKISGDYKNGMVKYENVFGGENIRILPIREEAILEVSFYHDGESVVLSDSGDNACQITMSQADDDTVAVCIGNLVIANKAEIPYKDNAVRVSIDGIEIKERSGSNFSENLLHNSTSIPEEIKIFNGEGKSEEIPLYIDYQKWLQTGQGKLSVEISLKDNGMVNDGSSRTYRVNMEVRHSFVDGVYALDLGTTGIVVAKNDDDGISCITLKDVERDDTPIETEEKILSSHILLLEKNDSKQFLLAPSFSDYYGVEGDSERKYRLVPIKFIVGQSKIPFMSDFYNDGKEDKMVGLFELENKDHELEKINLKLSNSKEQDESVVSDFIAALYKTIIERCGTEMSKIKKIILTYPNTYTIDVLEEIKKIFVEKLNLNPDGQIEFVPESDAVAAYYFNQKIMDKGFGFKDTGEVRNVVIYDMGAGTLDLSLVCFKNEGQGHITATIENKIGIPLAGNYLDYIIYKSLKNRKWLKDETQKNALKKLISTIKKEIDFSEEMKFSEKELEWIKEGKSDGILERDLDGSESAGYKDLFEDSLKDYIEMCSKTALHCLLTSDQKVDTIVFSGRGSLFKPLRKRVEEVLKENNKDVLTEELKPMEEGGDCLKTCVATGALMYQDYFSNDNIYKILNHNVYSKIAVVYWGKDDNTNTDVYVENLLDPAKEDWNDAKLISGTWCKSFDTDKNVVNSVNGKQMYFIQTCLDDVQLKSLYKKLYQNTKDAKEDLRWAFVNLLFKKKALGREIPISLRISEENKIIERKIGNEVLTDEKLLEDVEQSLLYKRSMWPFITD